jgi:enoyl-CoA hydratase/carnithine racemase
MRTLGPDALRDIDARALHALLDRTDFVLAIGDGELSSLSAAALLSADYAIVGASATLELDSPEAWGAAVWRIGSDALTLYFRGDKRLTAREAHALGLCDALGDGRDWLRGRSELALDAGAMLIRNRGGDALERAEFARLFAAGVPQEGLRAFLEKRRPSFAGGE